MRKRFCVYAVVMTAVVLCLSCGACFAAMRNLLMDFRDAIMKRDSEAAQAAIKSGVNASDGAKIILSFNPSDKDDNFFVPLIKALAKNGNFKEMKLFLGFISSNKVLEALLDGGADPDVIRNQKYQAHERGIGDTTIEGSNVDIRLTYLFEILDQLRVTEVIEENNKLLERMRILAAHKASLRNTNSVASFFSSMLDVAPTEAIHYFLVGRGLNNINNLTEWNLSSIVRVVKILSDAGADKGDAKSYLKKLREKYRNIPDAVKYIDEIEASFKSSSWFSW